MPVYVFGCVSCGKTVAGTERSCPRCGASFDAVMFECPFCGELVSPIQRRCESCGTEFDSFSEEVCETSAVDLDGAESAVKEESSYEPEEASAPDVVEQEQQEEVEFECPACGKRVGENDAKCPHCGTLFQ
jgi:predicted RNA-binding Zn-ribbon protein involved in translation (DUF1610 family)